MRPQPPTVPGDHCPTGSSCPRSCAATSMTVLLVDADSSLGEQRAPRAPDLKSGALAQAQPGKATGRQTPCLATIGRNCDHIATKPRVTGGDGCPTRTGDMAADQKQQGREGMTRTGGDGWCMTTDLAVRQPVAHRGWSVGLGAWDGNPPSRRPCYPPATSLVLAGCYADPFHL